MEINATFLGQAVAFLIFAYICMKYIWPPLMKALEQRQKEIADGLAAAEKAKKSLQLAQAGAKDTIREAKAQAQKIIDEANKQRSRIINDAQEEALTEKRRILEQAKNEINSEMNKAREELRSEITTLAVAGAEKILSAKVSAETDKAMLKKIVDTL